MEKRESEDRGNMDWLNNIEKPKVIKENDWRDNQLEEEMEEIFHPTPSHFSLVGMSFAGEVDGSPHFNEKDYELHRRGSFQHHQPLQKSSKRKKSSHKRKTEEQPPSIIPRVPEEQNSVENKEPTEDDPLLTTDGMKTAQADMSNTPKKLEKGFYVGSVPSFRNGEEKVPLDSILKESSFQSLVTAPLSPTQDISRCLRSSDETLTTLLTETPLSQTSEDTSQLGLSKNKVEWVLGLQEEDPEEAKTLQSADLDDIVSHRCDKRMNKRLLQHKATVPSKVSFIKKKYVLEPHELFVELHELEKNESTETFEWRQTARWIKYEEDVELGPDKWGKPHVSDLEFHSVLEVRKCLEGAKLLLDLEEKDLNGTLQKVVKCMVQNSLIEPEMEEKVLKILKLRHRHVNEKYMPRIRKNSSSYANLNLMSKHEKTSWSPLRLKTVKEMPESDLNNLANDESSAPKETVIFMSQNNPPMDLSKKKSESQEKAIEQGIQRKIHKDAEGAAVLMGKLDDLKSTATVFVRLAESKIMPHLLEIPIKVRFLFVVLVPSESNLDYHEMGRCICTFLSNVDFHNVVYKASKAYDLLHGLNNYLDNSIVMGPGKWEKQALLPLDEIRRKSIVPPRKAKDEPSKEPEPPEYDPLKRTGRIFGGLIKDIRYRYPWYLSDILDGFTLQCIASVIFIYFAAVSGAVAFGGLLAEKTGENVGVSETLIGTSVCGILFALFSGQPLIIIGTTAPLVLVDETLFQFKDNFSSNYLTIRAWVGIWCAVIAVVTVAFEGSMLVKFFSRFMQEVFATIISLIFIAESLLKLYRIFLENPLLPTYCNINETFINGTSSSKSLNGPHPNTALLSTILMIGTFYIAFFLRHFRNSKFLGRSARRALGDFGVPIGLVLMVLIAYFIPNTYTETLSVPEGLSPSTDRSWFIPLLPITIAEVAIAFVGGLLVFILLFMETEICELIISKKKLKKGSGFHLDLVIIGLMQVISGLIGGPWQCAATVRSISHTSSLIVWSKTHAPGESPYIIEVKEQRLTNFLVSFLVGASVLMAPVLRHVPLATLFGVFLYMGISSLSGIHLYERFLLIFMPTKHHPDFNFVRKVRTSKMHLYTLIQVFCIALLWIIKMYATIAFPFGLLSMIFVHFQIKRLFTPEEAKALDEENNENRAEEDDEPDFYEQIVA